MNTANAEVQRNILYFSKQCAHCTKFRQLLIKKPDLEAKFVQLCVDTLARGKLPRYVDRVPFIVVYDEKGRQINLSSNNAFGWLKDQLEQHAGDFEAYDSTVMSSTLSDSFMFLNEDAESTSGAAHTYEWLPGHRAERGGMYTPNESLYGGGSNKIDVPDNALEKLMEQRRRELPMVNDQKPPEIDFSLPLAQQQQQQRQAPPRVQQQPPQRPTQQYSEAARRQDVRIAPQRQGIDFANPNFRSGVSINRAPGLKPLANIRNNGPVGRRLPQNVPR